MPVISWDIKKNICQLVIYKSLESALTYNITASINLDVDSCASLEVCSDGNIRTIRYANKILLEYSPCRGLHNSLKRGYRDHLCPLMYVLPRAKIF